MISFRSSLVQTESQVLAGSKSLSAAAEREDSLKADIVIQHNRAEKWKVIALGAIALIPTAMLVARWL